MSKVLVLIGFGLMIASCANGSPNYQLYGNYPASPASPVSHEPLAN